MFRMLFPMLIVTGGYLLGVTASQNLKSEQVPTDLDALKKQRVQLLQDRVVAIQRWVDLERVDASELLRPEMDAINAQLDYAKSNLERKELLQKLLKKYDILIELAELRVEQPPRQEANESERQMIAESELLFLKSERIRVQVILDSLH